MSKMHQDNTFAPPAPRPQRSLLTYWQQRKRRPQQDWKRVVQTTLRWNKHYNNTYKLKLRNPRKNNQDNLFYWMETVYSTAPTQAPTATTRVNASEGDAIDPSTQFSQSRLTARRRTQQPPIPLKRPPFTQLTTTTQAPTESVE